MYVGGAASGGLELDTDNTEGYGPETITITPQRGFGYHFEVHNYSKDANFSTSNASVEVRSGGGVLRKFDVLATHSDTGYWWPVFSFNADEFLDVQEEKNNQKITPDEAMKKFRNLLSPFPRRVDEWDSRLNTKHGGIQPESSE